MSNDKIRLNAPSVAGGKDVATHTLATGEDIGRSTLAIYTPGSGGSPGTAADIDDTNPLPVTGAVTTDVDVSALTKDSTTSAAATQAHADQIAALAAIGDIFAALGATLDVSGSVAVSGTVDVANSNLDAALSTLATEATQAETHAALFGNKYTRVALINASGSPLGIGAPFSPFEVSDPTVESIAGTLGSVWNSNRGVAVVGAQTNGGAIGGLTLGSHGGLTIEGVASGTPVPVSMASLPAFAATPTVNLGTIGGAATEAKQDTGNAFLATLAGIVSAGSALANISDRVGRLLGVITGKDGATAASTTNGVPVAPETSSVWDVKDRVGRLVGVITGADGATAASVGNGVPVQPGTSTLWDVKDRVGRLIGLATGADGATGASLSNAHPVQPGTSTTWDVSSRAARLAGALTGINGSSVATGANPVPVQMSDGSAVFTAAKATQLPAALGPAAGSASLSTVPPTSTTYFTGTITSATVIQVVNGPCTVYHVEATNGSGGNLFVGLYDTSTTPSNGTDFPKIEIAAPNGSPATRDLATRGVKFSNKLYAVVASASRSATPAAQTAVGITIVYDT
jgi:hypothetical protein